MNYSKKKYRIRKRLTAIFMMLSLLWLSVSIPFVNTAQQELEFFSIPDHSDQNNPDTDDSSCNPFSNTTEEKTESGSGNLSEYVHHIGEWSHLAESFHQHNHSHSFSVYVAFHGEMLCPPPNCISS